MFLFRWPEGPLIHEFSDLNDFESLYSWAKYSQVPEYAWSNKWIIRLESNQGHWLSFIRGIWACHIKEQSEIARKELLCYLASQGKDYTLNCTEEEFETGYMPSSFCTPYKRIHLAILQEKEKDVRLAKKGWQAADKALKDWCSGQGVRENDLWTI